MAIFEKQSIAYYLSPVIKENRDGRREKHYHILCAQFTNQSGYHWLQIIGTSKAVEENNDNVIIIEPSACNIFTKKTRFNCDRVYSISEKNMQDAIIKGKLPETVFSALKAAIKKSEKVKEVYKKRMGMR